MPGWTFLFALLAVFGLIVTVLELPRPAAAPIIASFVFSGLLATILLLRVLRKRA